MYGQQIIQVTGENGCKALSVMPNSSVIALDDTDPLIWIIQTDGAGYKTIRPFKIEPYVAPEPINLNDIMERLNKIEERMTDESNTKPKRTTKSADTE